MEKIRLVIYETRDGKCPFQQWINRISDTQTQARIFRYVRSLSLGNFSNCRSLGEGVHELKINVGPGYRVYFANAEKTIIILLCGGTKKHQDKEIQAAQKYWADYKKREQSLKGWQQ